MPYTPATRDQIADTLARTYDGQPLAELRDEHAEPHLEAATALLASLEDDVEVSSYRIALLPAGHPMRSFAAITVRLCDSGRWQIDRLGFLLDVHGRWEQSAGKPPEWRSEHEYDLSAALDMARTAAPAVSVGGTTVAATLKSQAPESGRRNTRQEHR